MKLKMPGECPTLSEQLDAYFFGDADDAMEAELDNPGYDFPRRARELETKLAAAEAREAAIRLRCKYDGEHAEREWPDDILAILDKEAK